MVIILIVCFISIIAVTLSFFYRKGVSEYGQRLEDISKYPITEEFKSKYKEYFEKESNLTYYDFNIQGRIIYVSLKFNEKETLDKAKTLVEKSIGYFDESILGYYDVMFTMSSDNFTIIGAKNSVVETVSWNNNKKVEESTDEK